MPVSRYRIFFILLLTGLVMVSSVQAHEYSQIERTETIKLGKVSGDDDPGSGTDEVFGKVM